MEAFDDALNVVNALNAEGVELYRMKRGTVRPVDHADAALLRAAFNLDEER